MKKFAILMLCLVLLFTFVACTPNPNNPNPNDTDKPNPDDEKFVNAVSYADFGAVGDGKTDDFEAIKKAHEHANINGVAVKAQKDKKYYIAPREDCIPVKTDVDWTGAEFIIDDKKASEDSKVWWYSVFNVRSDTECVEIEVPDGMSVKAGQTKLDLTFEKPVMLIIYNDNHRDFIRYGNVLSEPRQELLLVDENGNVDPSTPVQWQYEAVTRITAFSTTDRPVLLRGGKFTTIANDDAPGLHYYERGLKIERSNTTVKNVEHYVTDEGKEGSPYGGFFRSEYASNVLFENCILTAHKTYKNSDGVNQGTYDTVLARCNNVKYLNCTQSNDITASDTDYWGIMGSNFCKNLCIQGCELSRVDAHMGVYNVTVKDSKIGQHVSITGGGTLLMENVVTYAKKDGWFNRFVTLRDDYGSFFYGDIIVKDCTMYSEHEYNYVIGGSWLDWEFGYECRYPKTVTIDNVRVITDTDESVGVLYVFTIQSNTSYADALKSKNPPVLTEKVTIKNNIDHTTGKPKTIFEMIPGIDSDWFKSVVVENVS